MSKSYLSPQELCQVSGLKAADLQRLEEAGLLRPTRSNPPEYRPKLAGWARKLAYLLGDSWTVEEIKGWSSERWTRPNPRLWPPPSKRRKDT